MRGDGTAGDSFRRPSGACVIGGDVAVQGLRSAPPLATIRRPSGTENGATMLELIDATKTYIQGRRTVNAVRGVTLTVRSGEFVTIMGPSGSGKSTLMHLMGALDTPTGGRAVFQGQDLQSHVRPAAVAPPPRPHRVRLPGIQLAPHPHGGRERRPAACSSAAPAGGRRSSRAAECLEKVNMAHRADHFPDELSGGEMQRVAVARALVADPEAVLCDEPTGNLDTSTSREILTLLSKLPEPGKRAVIMVTHDPTARVLRHPAGEDPRRAGRVGRTGGAAESAIRA